MPMTPMTPMTPKEKKEWLLQYGRIDRNVDALIAERDMWRSRAAHMSAGTGEPVSGKARGDSLGAAVAKIDRTERRISAEIGRMETLRTQISEAIDALPQTRERELLRLRYIQGLSLTDVAFELGYEYSYTTRLHGRALVALNVPVRRSTQKAR